MQCRTVSSIQIFSARARAGGREASAVYRLAVNWRHHSTDLSSLELTGIETSPFPAHAGGCKFDLILGVVDRDNVLALKVDHVLRYFSTEIVTRWLRSWNELLDQCLVRDVSETGALPHLLNSNTALHS